MRHLKKYLGIVWMVLAPGLVIFMCLQAIDRIGLAEAADKTNTVLQWVIILLVFVPVCIGLFIFGWYAWNDAFAKEDK